MGQLPSHGDLIPQFLNLDKILFTMKCPQLLEKQVMLVHQGAKDENHERNLGQPDSYFSGRWQAVSNHSIQHLIVGPWLPWHRLWDSKRALAWIHPYNFCASLEPACLPTAQRASVNSMKTTFFYKPRCFKNVGYYTQNLDLFLG